MKEITTRIIGGKYKGRVLKLPSKETTRGSKAILKGSFFDTIQFDIVEKILIEVFAGSGSIGIEALSRGAKKCYFIEQDRGAYKVLLENLSHFERPLYEAMLANSFEQLPHIMKHLSEPAYLYLDPPFAIREGNEAIYNQVIALIQALDTQKIIMVVLEHQSGVGFEEEIGGFVKTKSRRFGKSTLTYYMPKL